MSAFPLWLRVIVAALFVLPFLVVALAFSPTLLIAVALPKERREWLLQVLDRFVDWAKAIFSGTGKGEGDDA